MQHRKLPRTAGLAIVAALASVLAVAAPASAASQWHLVQFDADRCYDGAWLDANNNGVAEQIWWDLDNDCRWDTHLYNTRGHDSLAEEMSFDADENGRPEYVLQDVNQREGFEYLYRDYNQDGVYESVFPYRMSAVDTVDQSQSRVAGDRAITQQIVSMTPGYPTLAKAYSRTCAFCR